MGEQGAVAALVGAATRLRADAAGALGWPASDRRAALDALERVSALLVAARSDVLLAERTTGTWRRHGDPTIEAWHGRTTGAGRGDARARMRRAESWSAFSTLSSAAERGEITASHVDAVGRVAGTAATPVRDALANPAVQERLLVAARGMDAQRFAREVARTAARLDPAGLERDYERQRAERFLHLADAPDGTRITGLLDRQAGRRLRLSLEAASPRPAADDVRTGPQRLADALVTVADTVLSLPSTGSGAAVRPHVSFLMTADTWAGLRTAQARRVARGETPGLDPVPPLPIARPVEPVTDEEGLPIPFTEVARVLCDCALTRIVLDAEREPLDLGREQRTYTGAQRRAVLARDRGCAWEGCGTPARWCEIHHIRWWDRDGGATSVDNAVTLCRFHHHEVHRRDLDLKRRVDPERLLAGGADLSDPGPSVARYTVMARDGTVIAGGDGATTVATPRDGTAGPPGPMSDRAARLSA